ncbi:MAG: M50 family metallopeptidase [Leptospiraceae bacterium]|nr:M50 family metallopeptidase [Leptospiraceae bacterium]
MKTVILRVVALSVLIVLLIFFWQSPALKPLKLFVVFLHETSHAIATILTGGQLSAISIEWDESGATYAASGKGIFFLIAIAGYIGSILWGYIMLRASLTGRWIRTVSLLVGLTVIFFGFFPDGAPIKTSDKYLKYIISGGWGLMFTVSAFIFPRFNHLLLFVLGGLTALYSLYDLNDFIHGDVMRTDAGILAHYLLGKSALVKPLAYIIAGFISSVSIYIFLRLIRTALSHEAEEQGEVDLAEWQQQNPDVEITPEMLEWLKQKSRRGE